MADSTEDLKREMEAFEHGEETEEGSAASVETQTAVGGTRRTIPSWIYWVILGDVIILIGVLVYFIL